MGCRVEQAPNAIKTIHRHQVQRGFAARVEIEIDTTQRNRGFVSREPMNWNDEPAYHPKIGGAAHHLGSTSFAFLVVGSLRPFKGMDRVSAVADDGIDAIKIVFGIELEPL